MNLSENLVNKTRCDDHSIQDMDVDAVVAVVEDVAVFCLHNKAEEMDVTSFFTEQTITTVPKLLQEQTEKLIQTPLVLDANCWATIVMCSDM